MFSVKMQGKSTPRHFELLLRVELRTSSLPRMRSTTELKQHFVLSLSGRRGSNPRPPAWKASALSTELLPHFFRAFSAWVLMDSNHRSRKTADLQSAPFGHSGKHPCIDSSNRYTMLSNQHQARWNLLETAAKVITFFISDQQIRIFF